MKRFCLIIEDKAQKITYSIFEKNIKDRTGIDLEIISIDPSLSEFQQETDTEIIIDKDKLTKELKKVLKRRIDLVACDFDLSDDKINGLEVIRILKQLKPNKRIFLFSGKLDKIVKSILGSNDPNEILKNIKTLLNSKISDFVDRGNELIEDAIIKNLRNYSLDEELNHILEENQHIEFKSGYPPFRGKKLNEILKEIDDDSIKSQEFKNEILRLVISQIIGENE